MRSGGIGKVVLALAALAVAGCAGGTETGESPATSRPPADRVAAANELLADALAKRTHPAPVRVPAGYRLRTISDTQPRLQLAFPGGWSALRSHDVRFPGVLESFGRLNRGLATHAAGLAVPDSPLKLLAFDRDFSGDFVTTESVMQLPATGVHATNGWTRGVVAAVRKLPGVHPRVRSRRVSLPFGNAVRMEYVRDQPRDGRRIATVQYVVIGAEHAYVVTLSTLPRLLGTYERVVDASVRTLRADG